MMMRWNLLVATLVGLLIDHWLGDQVGSAGLLLALPVLGMRGTGEFSAAQRPTNYREAILYLFPNSPTSLTAVLSMLKSENTNDPKFTIFTKGLPTQRVVVSGAQTSGDTTIELTGTEPAKTVRKGHTLMNERTMERVWVSADPANPWTSVTVTRGRGSTAAAMNDGDGLVIVGTHHQEGAPTPMTISHDPAESSNWTQIFRTPVELTNTARATFLRTGPDMEERQREALEIHAMEREMAYIWGTGVEDLTGSKPERTTRGIVALVSSNVSDFAGALDVDQWETFLENVFEDGSDEKLMLAGNTALTNINKIARIHGEIQMTPMSETYGLNLSRYRTTYGFLQMRQHPLFSKNPTFNSWGIVVDTNFLVDRPLVGNGMNRDTQYLENRQAPGDDETKDEWLTESGLEGQFESVNGVFKGASGFNP